MKRIFKLLSLALLIASSSPQVLKCLEKTEEACEDFEEPEITYTGLEWAEKACEGLKEGDECYYPDGWSGICKKWKDDKLMCVL